MNKVSSDSSVQPKQTNTDDFLKKAKEESEALKKKLALLSSKKSNEPLFKLTGELDEARKADSDDETLVGTIAGSVDSKATSVYQSILMKDVVDGVLQITPEVERMLHEEHTRTNIKQLYDDKAVEQLTLMPFEFMDAQDLYIKFANVDKSIIGSTSVKILNNTFMKALVTLATKYAEEGDDKVKDMINDKYVALYKILIARKYLETEKEDVVRNFISKNLSDDDYFNKRAMDISLAKVLEKGEAPDKLIYIQKTFASPGDFKEFFEYDPIENEVTSDDQKKIFKYLTFHNETLESKLLRGLSKTKSPNEPAPAGQKYAKRQLNKAKFAEIMSQNNIKFGGNIPFKSIYDKVIELYDEQFKPKSK